MSCNHEKTSEDEHFILNRFDVSVETDVRRCFKLNEGYICVTVDDRFIFLNNKFELDSIITNKIHKLKRSHFKTTKSFKAPVNSCEIGQAFFINPQ